MILLFFTCTLLFFLNGLFVYLIIFRNRKKTIQDVILISSVLSIFISTVTGFVLAIFKIFTKDFLWVVITTETLIAMISAIYLYRGSFKNIDLKGRIGGLLNQKVDFSAVLSFFVIVIIIFIFYAPILTIDDHLSNHSSWSYYFDALRIVEERAIPKTTIYFNQVVPFEIDKISFNILTAEVIAMGGIRPLAFMNLFPIFVITLTILGAWSFSRVFFRRATSLLIISILFLMPFVNFFFMTRIPDYQAQTMGIALMFVVLYLISKGILENDRVYKVVSALIYPIIVTTHIPIAIICGFVWFFIQISDLFFAAFDKKRLFQAAVNCGMVVILVLLFYGGTGRLFVFTDTLIKKEKISEYNGYDPTYEMWSIEEAYGKKHREFSDETFYMKPGEIASSLIFKGFFYIKKDELFDFLAVRIAIISFLLISALLTLLLGQKNTKIIVLSILLSFLFIFIVGMMFSYLYDNYIYGSFVPRRLGRILVFFPAFVVMGFFDTVWELVYKKTAKVKGRSGSQLSYLLLAIFLLPLLAIQNSYMQDYYREKPVKLSRDGYSALLWLRDNAEGDSLVLSNLITGGDIYVIGNCRGLMEGQLPFLNNSLTRCVLDAAYDAKAFYEGKSDIDILEKYEIDYVILDRKNSLAGFRFVYHTKLTDLTKYEKLELVESYGYVKIFKVKK